LVSTIGTECAAADGRPARIRDGFRIQHAVLFRRLLSPAATQRLPSPSIVMPSPLRPDRNCETRALTENGGAQMNAVMRHRPFAPVFASIR
jgi:hypothetical protein